MTYEVWNNHEGHIYANVSILGINEDFKWTGQCDFVII